MFSNLHTLDRPLLEKRSMGLDSRSDLMVSRNSAEHFLLAGWAGDLTKVFWVTFEPLFELAQDPQVPHADGRDLPEGNLRAAPVT